MDPDESNSTRRMPSAMSYNSNGNNSGDNSNKNNTNIKKKKEISHLTRTASMSRTQSLHGTALFSAKAITAEDRQRVLEEKKKTIFLPWSKNYSAWWLLTAFFALFTIFFETYYIAFCSAGFTPYGSSTAVIEYLLNSIFIIDIIVNFNLAYYDAMEGEVIYERRQIAIHYLKTTFFLDFVGIFPFYLIALACAGQVGQDNHLTQYLALFRLIRLTRGHKVIHLFSILQYKTRISFISLTLCRNFAVALVWSHFAACVMYFIARQYHFSENTFIGAKVDVNELTHFELYCTSMYWSIVTFATVGYGDYSAYNVYEQVWCVIYMLINIIIQAWMIGTITLLVVRGDEKAGIYREALKILHQYAALHSFDKTFEKSLRNQLKLEFDNQEIADEQVLKHFPSSVRRKVLRKLYLQPLIQTDLMKGVRQQFVDAFLAACHVEIFSPGEEILQRGSISSYLYLLVGGVVKVLPWDVFTGGSSTTPDFGNSVPDSDYQSTMNSLTSSSQTLESGEFINEIGFFTESPQLDTVRTVTVCKTLTMSRTTYKLIAEDHPGSIGRILSNLLEKVGDTAKTAGTIPHVSLPKRMEILKAGSVFDDGEDGSYHLEVLRSVQAVQSQTSLTAVQDLVKMHMNKLKDDHTTRFLFAASRGDIATLTLMCEHGLDPNTADYDSRTALMVASMKGNTEAVKKLLEFHCNPNLVDMHGSSALLEAVRCGHADTAEVLRQHGAELCMSESKAASTLCQAVYDGDVVTLRRLLQAGIDANASDYDKRSAAHIAAAEGNVAALKVLSEYGADLTLQDRWSNTIDDEAQRSNSTPLLNFVKSLRKTMSKPVVIPDEGGEVEE